MNIKRLALLIAYPAQFALAFDFTYSAPTQCDNLNISWSGGRAPFSLLITPFFYPAQNISIPESAFNAVNNSGTFSTQLTLPAGQRFLLTMSDATGFGSGGTSNVLSVGSSVSGAKCNTTEPSVDFFFQLNDSLQQCRTFTFSDYDAAVQPVTIFGLIPLGQTFVLNPPVGPTSFDWTANVAAGTSVAFVLTDAQGRRGGSSDLLLVSKSDEFSCLNSSSPHSTANAPTSTNSASSLAPPSSTQTGSSRLGSNNGLRSGDIAGIVIGSVAAFSLVLLAIIICLGTCRRKPDPSLQSRTELGRNDPEPVLSNGVVSRQSRVSRFRNSLFSINRRHTQNVHPVDLIPPRPFQHLFPSESSLPPPSQYEPNPFILPSEASVNDGHSTRVRSGYTSRQSHSTPITPLETNRTSSHSLQGTEPPTPVSTRATQLSHRHSRHPSLPLSVNSTSSPTRKSATSLYFGAPRFIVHRDAEDSTTNSGEEVVELPPQYSDRRDPDGDVENTLSPTSENPSDVGQHD